MDLYPVDAAGVRGGDGVLDIRDLIRELFRVNNLDMDRPVRATRGGCGTGGSGQPSTSLTRTTRDAAAARARATVQGTLALGSPVRAGSQERIPAYLPRGK